MLIRTVVGLEGVLYPPRSIFPSSSWYRNIQNGVGFYLLISSGDGRAFATSSDPSRLNLIEDAWRSLLYSSRPGFPA